MAVRVSVDSDTWWHLRAGAEIVEKGAVITSDPFSMTRYQESWRYPGWFAQVMLYAIYQVSGFAGLNLLTAFMVTLAFLWVWRFIEGPILLRSALILLAATTSGVYWSARPQIMSFALSGVFIYLLERELRGDNPPLWAFFVTMALWGNLHGGFAIGFLLLGAYFGGAVLDLAGKLLTDPTVARSTFKLNQAVLIRYMWVVSVSLLGLSLNPHGPSMLLYPFKTVSIGILREYIQEWQSPDFHALGVQPFLGMIILAFISFSLKKDRIHPTDTLLVLGFLGMSLWAARNIAIFALAVVIPISRALASIQIHIPWVRSSKQVPPAVQKYLNSFLAIFLVAAAMLKIATPLSNTFNEKTLDEAYPSGAIAYLSTNQEPGPLFNSYNWGAYLIWELYPAYRSFVDGRTDLFDDDVLEQYLLVWRAEPGWSEVLEDWGIGIALVEPNAPIAFKLHQAGWQRVYEDTTSVIFTRPEGG